MFYHNPRIVEHLVSRTASVWIDIEHAIYRLLCVRRNYVPLRRRKLIATAQRHNLVLTHCWLFTTQMFLKGGPDQELVA